MGWLEARYIADDESVGPFKLILNLGGPSDADAARVVLDEVVAVLGPYSEFVDHVKVSNDDPLTLVVYLATDSYLDPATRAIANELLCAYEVPVHVGLSHVSDSPHVYRYE